MSASSVASAPAGSCSVQPLPVIRETKGKQMFVLNTRVSSLLPPQQLLNAAPQSWGAGGLNLAWEMLQIIFTCPKPYQYSVSIATPDPER